jgi:hypothetical protein
MAVCTFPQWSSFVSDCADIVCAAELTANYFLSAFASSQPSHVVFPPELVGPSEMCGSVNLSSWLHDAPSTTTQDDAAVITKPTVTSATAPRAAIPSSSTASNTSVVKSSPTYVWRPITLGVLAFILFAFLVIDTLLFVLMLRRRRALRAQRSEQDNCPT